MDEPVPRRLRPARRRGLTRPDPVTAPPRPSQPPASTCPQAEEPDKPPDRSAAGKPRPEIPSRSSPAEAGTPRRRQNLRGGSRLSLGLADNSQADLFQSTKYLRAGRTGLVERVIRARDEGAVQTKDSARMSKVMVSDDGWAWCPRQEQCCFGRRCGCLALLPVCRAGWSGGRRRVRSTIRGRLSRTSPPLSKDRHGYGRDRYSCSCDRGTGAAAGGELAPAEDAEAEPAGRAAECGAGRFLRRAARNRFTRTRPTTRRWLSSKCCSRHVPIFMSPESRTSVRAGKAGSQRCAEGGSAGSRTRSAITCR
jgi:hypothetical protein